ncbi:MAG TPA: 2OG-Fe(II) oxygenase [Kiloniellaceae bacterium]|nr:2OG-Fe(II) oxygenase [Kiloniellaceae bacterium]
MAQDAASALLDLAAFEAAPLRAEPFDHVVVPDFVPPAQRAEICRDFPAIDQGGSFPVERLAPGPRCAALIEALQSAPLRTAFAEKFGVSLAGRPSMVTLRGHSRAKDGRIHTDSKSKILTALVYLNEDWTSDSGRLRLLRGPDDLEDYQIEVAPDRGTLVAFRCSDRAYHGYPAFIGARRSLQLNWVLDEGVKTRELSRHGLSARLKSLRPFAGRRR